MSYELDRDERGLTKTEREVLELLEKGVSMRDIAKQKDWTRQRAYKVREQLRAKGAIDG